MLNIVTCDHPTISLSRKKITVRNHKSGGRKNQSGQTTNSSSSPQPRTTPATVPPEQCSRSQLCHRTVTSTQTQADSHTTRKKNKDKSRRSKGLARNNVHATRQPATSSSPNFTSSGAPRAQAKATQPRSVATRQNCGDCGSRPSDSDFQYVTTTRKPNNRRHCTVNSQAQIRKQLKEDLMNQFLKVFQQI